MDTISTLEVTSFRDSGSLVGIEREKIDVNTIHGFIVDLEDEWVLLQRVFDFYADGWVLLRRGDISVLQSKPTEVFQRALLEGEGSLARVDFTRRLPEGGIITMLRGFESDQVVILEEETEDEDRGRRQRHVLYRLYPRRRRWDC